jgi:hypothetical protein
MTKRVVASGALAAMLSLGLAACADPYDPTRRAIAGGTIGAGSGTAIGALAGGGTGAVTGAVTTPEPPPPPPR